MAKIFIPYHNESCIFRAKAFSRVYNYYISYGFDVIVLSSKPFTRAAARNAVFETELKDKETIFFADADIIIPIEQVREAIKEAQISQGMVLAYDKLVKTNFGDHNLSGPFNKVIKFQCSGGFAIPVALLNKTQGWDERFTTWGCEDRVFYYTAAYLVGKQTCKRLTGKAYHLYHPKDLEANNKTLRTNSLHQKYLEAFGISVKTLKAIKPANKKQLERLFQEKNQNSGYKKLIVPFKEQEILTYKKKRKILKVIKNSKIHNQIKQTSDYVKIDKLPEYKEGALA